MLLVEEWRAISGWPAYEASTLGRIRRVKAGKGAKVGRILSLFPARKRGNYPMVGFYRPDGRHSSQWVHILICATFHGPKPSPNHEVAHWDGNPQNVAPDNLRWATSKENKADSIRLDRTTRGERHGGHKLTANDVLRIRAFSGRGWPSRYLADEFGVSQSAIDAIAKRKTWKWLPETGEHA